KCIEAHPPIIPAPSATQPAISTDATLQPVQKVISWGVVQKKMDEFFNKRLDPPIFKIRLHNQDYIPPGTNTVSNDDRTSTATISMIEAEVVNGQVTTEYAAIN